MKERSSATSANSSCTPLNSLQFHQSHAAGSLLHDTSLTSHSSPHPLRPSLLRAAAGVIVGNTCASLPPANQQQCLNDFVLAQQTKANGNKPGDFQACMLIN